MKPHSISLINHNPETLISIWLKNNWPKCLHASKKNIRLRCTIKDSAPQTEDLVMQWLLSSTCAAPIARSVETLCRTLTKFWETALISVNFHINAICNRNKAASSGRPCLIFRNMRCMSVPNLAATSAIPKSISIWHELNFSSISRENVQQWWSNARFAAVNSTVQNLPLTCA